MKAGGTVGGYFVPRYALENASHTLVGLSIKVKLADKRQEVGRVISAEINEDGEIVLRVKLKDVIKDYEIEGTIVNFHMLIATEKRGTPHTLENLYFYEIALIVRKQDLVDMAEKPREITEHVTSTEIKTKTDIL